jgi:flagellar M-ring protein FliF
MGGEVRKLSVAVLVEGKTEPAATEGSEPTYTPLSETERNNLRTLVQTAMGFDAARGDRVEIIDMRFSPIIEPEAVAEPFLTKEQMILLAQYALIALAVGLVGLLVVKPALTTINTALNRVPASIEQPLLSGAPGATTLPMGEGSGGDAMINISSVQGRVRESAIKKVGEIVDQYPEESLGVIRSWMSNTPTSGSGRES